MMNGGPDRGEGEDTAGTSNDTARKRGGGTRKNNSTRRGEEERQDPVEASCNH